MKLAEWALFLQSREEGKQAHSWGRVLGMGEAVSLKTLREEATEVPSPSVGSRSKETIACSLLTHSARLKTGAKSLLAEPRFPAVSPSHPVYSVSTRGAFLWAPKSGQHLRLPYLTFTQHPGPNPWRTDSYSGRSTPARSICQVRSLFWSIPNQFALAV